MEEGEIKEPGPEAAAGPTSGGRGQMNSEQAAKLKGVPRTESNSMMDLGVDEILKTMLSSRGGSDASAGGT